MIDPMDTQTQPTIKRRKPRAKIPTPIQAKIIEVATNHPDLSSTEIGKICNASHVHVLNTFNRYGIDRQSNEDYKHNRADIFSGLQNRVLQSITDTDIKSIDAAKRTTMVGILYDKERLERGQSTQNIAINTMSEDEIDAELSRLYARLNVIDITPEDKQIEDKSNGI